MYTEPFTSTYVDWTFLASGSWCKKNLKKNLTEGNSIDEDLQIHLDLMFRNVKLHTPFHIKEWVCIGSNLMLPKMTPFLITTNT